LSGVTETAIQGRILHVDLSAGKLWTEIPEQRQYRRFLGGRALALYFLLRELKPEADPLGPENIVVIAAGLLNGLPGPGIPKFSIASKSPITGGVGESEAGGFWGPALRFCGWDAVVIHGRAAKPVYLAIRDQEAYLESAEPTARMDTKQFQEQVRQQHQDARVLQIGLAGMNCVRFANVVNDLSFFNGRNGLGAVWGSKNLRAVVVQPSKRTLGGVDTTKVVEIAREASKKAQKNPLSSALHELGTAGGIAGANAGGVLPTRNWTTTVFEHAADISGERLRDQFLKKRHGCFACPIRCKGTVEITEGKWVVDPAFGGPEFESIAALGSLCGVGDMSAVCKANELCNRFGMDTISAGATIAFAMHCWEEGIITKDDVGYDLPFGTSEGLVQMVEDIAEKRRLGELLSEGSFRAAEKLGIRAQTLCRHARKQELPMHDARAKTGMALQYALSPRGADHWIAQHDPFFKDESSPGLTELAPLGINEPVDPKDLGPRKVQLFHQTQMLCSAYDTLGVCTLAAVARSAISLEEIRQMVEIAIGRKTSWYELLKCGERAVNMARVFNLRAGIGKEGDVLPEIFAANMRGGPGSGSGAIDTEKFRESVALFYRMSGWDENGVPAQAKLIELGISELTEIEASK